MRTLWISLLANFMNKFPLPSYIQVSSTAFLLWCWQVYFNSFKVYTPMLSSRTRKRLSFPSHQLKESSFMWPHHLESVPGSEPSLWMRISGIYLMIDLTPECHLSILHPITWSRMLSPDGLKLIRAQGYTWGWGQPTKNRMVAIWEWQGRQEHREAAATVMQMRKQKSCDLLTPILCVAPLSHLPSQLYFPESPHMYHGGFLHLVFLDVLLPWTPPLSAPKQIRTYGFHPRWTKISCYAKKLDRNNNENRN